MNKKVIIIVLIIGLLSIGACGQKSSKTISSPTNIENTAVKTKQKKIMTDEEVIEKLGPSDNSSNHQEDIVELKHWKYGVKPPDMQESRPTPAHKTGESDPLQQLRNPAGPQDAADYRKPVFINIISEKEMDIICANLIVMQYLPTSGFSEADFKAAVLRFQTDNSLKESGNLDSETLKLLLVKP